MVERDHTGMARYNGAGGRACSVPSFRPMRRVSRYSARECSWAPARVSRLWSPQAMRPSQASDIVGAAAVISVKTLNAWAVLPAR